MKPLLERDSFPNASCRKLSAFQTANVRSCSKNTCKNIGKTAVHPANISVRLSVFDNGKLGEDFAETHTSRTHVVICHGAFGFFNLWNHIEAIFNGTTRYEGNHFKLNLSRFRQRKFCISILFLRNPKNRLTHCPVEFYNSLNRLHFGDVEKQCCDAGTESRLSRRFCPDFFEFRQKGSRFRFRIAAIRACAKQRGPNPLYLGRVVRTMPGEGEKTLLPLPYGEIFQKMRDFFLAEWIRFD